VAHRGDFFIVVRRDVGDDEAVEAFSTWLRGEARRDGTVALDGSSARPDVRTGGRRATRKR
jgi:hypothetical protein